MKILILLLTICLFIFCVITVLDVKTEGVVINQRFKPYLKLVVDKTKNLIYREATEHNPAGDILPDKIDDAIKGEIKDRIN